MLEDCVYIAIIDNGILVDGKSMVRGNRVSIEHFVNRALRCGVIESNIHAFKIEKELEFSVKIIED